MFNECTEKTECFGEYFTNRVKTGWFIKVDQMLAVSEGAAFDSST